MPNLQSLPLHRCNSASSPPCTATGHIGQKKKAQPYLLLPSFAPARAFAVSNHGAAINEERRQRKRKEKKKKTAEERWRKEKAKKKKKKLLERSWLRDGRRRIKKERNEEKMKAGNK
jgi:hypothetical protein